jgi:hypothetical protein
MIAISCFAAISLGAQTTTDTTGTMSTETTKVVTTTTKKKAPAGMSRTRVRNDASRLAAILSDAQNKASFPAAAWKVTANEANSLANHIYASSGGRKEAKELRTHVQQMREAALKGDADGAREHASEALPYAYELIDWAK